MKQGVKLMKYATGFLTVALLTFGLLPASCEQEYKGPTKTEKAIVIDKTYLPSQVSDVSGIAPVFGGDGGIAVVSATSTSPEVWAVVFQCDEHGQTFALRGKQVYEICKIGDTVELEYVEIFRTTRVDRADAHVVDYHTTRVRLPSGRGASR